MAATDPTETEISLDLHCWPHSPPQKNGVYIIYIITDSLIKQMVFIGGVGYTVIILQTTQRVLSASDSMGFLGPLRNNSNADSKMIQGQL